MGIKTSKLEFFVLDIDTHPDTGNSQRRPLLVYIIEPGGGEVFRLSIPDIDFYNVSKELKECLEVYKK